MGWFMRAPRAPKVVTKSALAHTSARISSRVVGVIGVFDKISASWAVRSRVAGWRLPKVRV